MALSGVFLLHRVDDRIHTYSTKNRPVLDLGWSFGELHLQIVRESGVRTIGQPIMDSLTSDSVEPNVPFRGI